MPDLARIGGVTGWMQAAGLAAAHGIPMSSHLFPEVSAHLLAATPTCHWLEYVDWANAWCRSRWIVDGCAVIPDRPGNGLVWDEAAVTRYRIHEFEPDAPGWRYMPEPDFSRRSSPTLPALRPLGTAAAGRAAARVFVAFCFLLLADERSRLPPAARSGAPDVA